MKYTTTTALSPRINFIKLMSEEQHEIFDMLSHVVSQHGQRAYIIGGVVRDLILNRPCQDFDVVCEGDGNALAQAVSEHLGGIQVAHFKRFGTAMLKFNGFDIEFVGARKESYTPDSRKPSVSAGTLTDDQLRRDFTINALSISLNPEDLGALHDPFDGITDIEKGIVRTPRDPDETFSDDPLRMFRAIRFASQLGFKIEEQTWEGIKRNHARISILSMERMTTEFNKIIQAPHGPHGIDLLSQVGILNLYLPEMENLRGVEIRNNIGHKDNYYHTLEVLQNIMPHSNNLWLRWSALMHDIAKPHTKRFHPKAGWTFHGHEVVGQRVAKAIFKRLKLPLDSHLKYVQKMIRLHLRPIALTKDEVTDSAIRRLLFDAGDDIDDLMMLCHADITSKNEFKVKRYHQNFELVKAKLVEVEAKDHLRNWQPPITGEVIMETFDIKPSRTVGIIKDAIREAILAGDIPNEYDAALAYMQEYVKSKGLV